MASIMRGHRVSTPSHHPCRPCTMGSWVPGRWDGLNNTGMTAESQPTLPSRLFAGARHRVSAYHHFLGPWTPSLPPQLSLGACNPQCPKPDPSWLRSRWAEKPQVRGPAARQLPSCLGGPSCPSRLQGAQPMSRRTCPPCPGPGPMTPGPSALRSDDHTRGHGHSGCYLPSQHEAEALDPHQMPR